MNRKTLVAGGVFAGLILIAFAVLRSPEKGTRTGEAPRPVAKLSPGDFDTLEVTKGTATTTFKKDSGTFKVTAPIAYAADLDAAKQAFEAIENLSFSGIVSDQKAKHDEYEVGAAALRVTAKKGDRVLVDMRLGKPGSGTTMVRSEGKDDVWQADGSLKYLFDKDSSAWRDKSITTFDEGDAEKIEVSSKTGGRIVLSRPPRTDAGTDDGWAVTESAMKIDPYDKTVAPGIISGLYTWKTNDFADGAKASDTGLDTPDKKIAVSLKGGKKIEVLLGKKKGEDDFYVQVTGNPQVFLVKKYNLERINKRPIDFKDRTVCSLNESEITEVSVTREKDSFTLSKSGKPGAEAWKLTKPAGITLDTSKVSPLLLAFKDWKAPGFADDNSPKVTGLAKPSATISAKSSVKGNGCVVKVGGPTAADKINVYLQRTGSPDVLFMPGPSLDHIMLKLDELKKK